jgi:hypothetical protein
MPLELHPGLMGTYIAADLGNAFVFSLYDIELLVTQLLKSIQCFHYFYLPPS